jgi:peptide/nickel transport system substrate-binding protein
MYGQSVVLDTYLPPNHPLFNADAKHYAYDVAAAGALLDEIGWKDADNDPTTPRVATGVTGVKDGTPLSFTYESTNSALRQQVTQIVAQNLAGCGIEAKITLYPASQWFAVGEDAKLAGRRFDLGEFAWSTGVEPPCDLYLSSTIPSAASGWSGQDYGGYANPDYDTACNTQRQSLPGEAVHDSSAKQAQLIFSQDLPVVPLFLRLKLAATRPDMCNFINDPTNNSEMWNIEAFDYGAGCTK